MTRQHEPASLTDDEIDKAISREFSVRYLRTAIVTLLLGAVGFVTVIGLVTPDPTARAGGPVAGIVVLATVWILLSRGRLQAAVNVMAIGTWLVITGIAIFHDGVRASMLVGYPLLIVYIGWRISLRAATAVAGLTIATLVGLVLADPAGLLPVPPHTPPVMHGIIHILFVALATILIVALVHAYQNRLRELRALSKDLVRRSADLEAKTAELNQAQAIGKIGSWTSDIANDTLNLSAETCRILDLPEGIPRSYQDYLERVHAQDRGTADLAWREALKGAPFDHEYRMMVGQDIRWIRQRAEFERGSDGRPVRAVGVTQDITARKKAEQEIATLLAEQKIILDTALVGIAFLKNRVIVRCNRYFANMLGYAAEELEGQSTRIVHLSEAAYQERSEEIYAEVQRTGMAFTDAELRRRDGSTFPCSYSIGALDANDLGQGVVWVVQDISERREAEERIAQLAYNDALTGLFNRLSLQERLEQALATVKREQRALAVMFIDMDRFKVVNDTLGHAVGDELLVEVARRLHQAVRDSDIAARLGGDEFVVVLTEVEGATATARVADKILRTLGQPYRIREHDLHSTPSIGLAFFPTDGDDVESLLKNADTAMYHAKAQGRNNVQFFTPAMNEIAMNRLRLDRELRVALEQGQFELHYQPQLETCAHIDDCDTCANCSCPVVGVEALVRWRHPRDGLVSPLNFIPVAEETGLILPLGEWVLNEACRQLRVWRDEGVTAVTMAVNLSAHQLRSPKLLGFVAETLDRHGLTGADLELEITESVVMDDPDASIDKLHELRELGIKLSIDDFGTGYSSLSYLKLLPIHTLKLDRSFVRDIETDSNDIAICTATIALAHNLGLAVVAEGVETEAQRTFLTRQRCDFLQGYLFSRPLLAEATSAFIRNRGRSDRAMDAVCQG